MLLTLFLAALAGPPTPRVAPAPIPVTVVLMDAFGNDRLIGAVRRLPGPGGKELVVVKRSALTPEIVVGLAGSLVKSMERTPGTPAAPINLYYMQGHRWPPPSPPQLAWARAVIGKLLAAPKTDVGKLGRQSAVTVAFESE